MHLQVFFLLGLVTHRQPPMGIKLFLVVPEAPLSFSVVAVRRSQRVQVWFARMRCCYSRLLHSEALALDGYI